MDNKKRIILRHYSGNICNHAWSYEAREIVSNKKEAEDLFIARVSAEKTETGYRLFVKHIEYDEEGKIQFKPENQIDLTNAEEVNKELKRKLRHLATKYAKEQNLPLEDKLDGTN